MAGLPAGKPASPTESEHGEEGYVGPATVLLGGAEVVVEVDLRGQFQPIDGRIHWYGRITANPELDRLVSGNRAEVVLRTPSGTRRTRWPCCTPTTPLR